MAAPVASFTALPKTLVNGGAVRFFPVVTGLTVPIITWTWDFDDGGATSAEPSPTHTFPNTAHTYNVTFHCHYAAGTASNTATGAVVVSVSASVPDAPAYGAYSAVSIFLYNATKSIMVNRNPITDYCTMLLLKPVVNNIIDAPPVTKFTLLLNDATADERSLVSEGTNVVILQGDDLVFSGVVKRVTQATQGAFAATTPIQLWDFECGNDLMKLSKLNVLSTQLQTAGTTIIDTPGNIARKILTPTVGGWDWRGNIFCNDPPVEYQINPSTEAEQVPSQYEQLQKLWQLTNYDLSSIMDYEVISCNSFLTNTITVSAASWTDDALIGYYALFVGRNTPISKTFTTNFASNNTCLLIANADLQFEVGNRVLLTSTTTLPHGLIEHNYVKTVTSTYITVSLTNGGSAVTFDSDGTGTHSAIRDEEYNGVIAYGKVTYNTATTIVLALAAGSVTTLIDFKIVLLKQPLIDFAPNLSTQSSVATFDVNDTIFEYSDNDDKRKLYTKVIAKGKDSQGKNISVAISGVHAYNLQKQFFNDSTFITKKCEGYVYKNNNTKASHAVTANTAQSEAFTTNWAGGGQYAIFIASNINHFVVGARCQLDTTTGTLPPNLLANVYYWISGVTATYIEVTAVYNTPGYMTSLDLGGDAVGMVFITVLGSFNINNSDSYLVKGDSFLVGATSLPGNVHANTIYYCKTDIKLGALECFDFATTPQGAVNGIVQNQPGSGVIIWKLASVGNPPPLASAPTVWLYGWNFAIPTGSNCALSSPGVSVEAVTTTGSTTQGRDTNGTMYTAVTLTTWLSYDYSDKGYFLNKKLWVDNHTYVENNDVLIGEEHITIDSSGTDTTYGDFIQFASVIARVTSASKKCYPHDVGALVARTGATNYTESNPEPLSVVADYGLHINTVTVETNTTYGQLDAYATALLLGFGAFYKKATAWLPIYYSNVERAGVTAINPNQTTPLRINDRIDIVETNGGTPVDYQIVAISIKYDEGRVELTLGDYEKNIFTSLQQNTAINKTLT